MAVKKKTVLNIVVILFILSFFITPLGHYGKLFLNQIFSFSPEIVEIADRKKISDYSWRLKDAEWNFFNFEKSKGKVIFINFWASWRLPSEAELKSIQALYDDYKDKVDFYIITNENRPPVEEFMAKNKFHFPVTYLIIGDKSSVKVPEKPPYSYIIDKEGTVVVEKDGIADWNTSRVRALLDDLLAK
ncbi:MULTISPECIES: TlpA family protein disulfide reductase [unclassified Croceitalea]|uniref:TlpA family protein disulfide reductase n=1 Tax=unclassified Croceitalea TaxID=2632280 RepID=UPI0030DD134D